MSRQLRASRYAARSSTRPRASRFVDDYDDLDGAGPSGNQNSFAQPPAAAEVGASEATEYGSDWELEIDESDNDHTWVPPRKPVNLPGDHDLSDSDTEIEFDEELDDVDYVRMHDVSMESVPDSDLPLKFRLARLAQVNAPGTDAFSWRRKTPALVRRGAFLGVYTSCILVKCCSHIVLTKRYLHTRY